MRAAFAVVLLSVLAATAHAEPWYRGRYGRNRVVHLSITAGGGLLYPLANGLEDDWAATTCRWCAPTRIDRGVRDALRWNGDVPTAKTLSDLGAFAITPAVSIALVLTGTSTGDRSWARLIDDVTPILETMVVTQWITRGLKLGVGRQRPYAHYGAPEGSDDNLSFPSGHTSRAFAFAASAGFIAHARGYAAEPYVWAGGMALAAATGYFRIAADRHYLTDVLAGAAIGAGAGLTVPYLMWRCEIEVVPTRSGVTFAGVW